MQVFKIIIDKLFLKYKQSNSIGKIYYSFIFTFLLILFKTIIFLVVDLFTVKENMIIKVQNKFEQVNNKNTAYFVQTKNKTYRLSFNLFVWDTKSAEVYNQINENQCYLVDIQGLDFSFLNQSIQKLKPINCPENFN